MRLTSCSLAEAIAVSIAELLDSVAVVIRIAPEFNGAAPHRGAGLTWNFDLRQLNKCFNENPSAR